MPRQARVIVPGFSHQNFQRGRNRHWACLWLEGFLVKPTRTCGKSTVIYQAVRIARVIFTMFRGEMVLLNGFIKKTQKTPDQELAKARDRRKNLV
ncbi:type II toxin-antitoxin system RelE/ParE family toxin [Marinobacter sp. ANT_B65]|uniref:type II toxin-antitoxin system RelE/ParE family toxin n=1 Tax=Marinobacter sp. ANT_B65 TaxID=2039467 RepID=UPI001D0D0315|nr:type II toxin-antitoxin system RelE/ParE family toxin [Marinobacter sp. ANT_B65]